MQPPLGALSGRRVRARACRESVSIRHMYQIIVSIVFLNLMTSKDVNKRIGGGNGDDCNGASDQSDCHDKHYS